MASERPPRGPLESNTDEPITRGALLSRTARRLAAAADIGDIRRVLAATLTSALGPSCVWELHAGGTGDSGELPAVDPDVTALAGMGASIIAGLPERTIDGASSIVVAPATAGGQRNELVVPLGRAGRLGTLLVAMPSSDSGFPPDDAELVAGVAAQVALALDRLRGIAIRGSQRRIKTDLRAAAEVQQSLLPKEPDPSCGFVVRTAFEPCWEVGGDCYDFVVGAPGELTVLIGDAAGKGVAAALLMTRVSAEFRGLVEAGLGPTQVLAGLNRSLTLRPAGEGFATALCLALSTTRGEARAANAGHVLPLLRNANGQVRAFAPPSGAPLGFVDDETYDEARVAIRAGDILVLMTDGLLDALGAAGDELGMQAAVELIARAPHDVDGLRAHVLAVLAAAYRTGDRRQRDDVTMVVLQVAETGA